jgi:hypothetical protein
MVDVRVSEKIVEVDGRPQCSLCGRDWSAMADDRDCVCDCETVPLVHYCGTPGSLLLESRLAAADAVREAISALVAAAPDARDYHPRGVGAFDRAHRAHGEHLHSLLMTLSWLMRQAAGIDVQMK